MSVTHLPVGTIVENVAPTSRYCGWHGKILSIKPKKYEVFTWSDMKAHMFNKTSIQEVEEEEVEEQVKMPARRKRRMQARPKAQVDVVLKEFTRGLPKKSTISVEEFSLLMDKLKDMFI